MAITKLTSREFNQDTSRAKRPAELGPVIITDRGRPAHVLLSFEDYQRLTLDQGGFIDSLGLPPGVEDVELETRRCAISPAPPTSADVSARPRRRGGGAWPRPHEPPSASPRNR